MISGAAYIAGVIGDPIQHSLSPRLHNYWLQDYDMDGAYIPLQVGAENLGRVLRTLPMMGFRGVNITVPHKEAALAEMDEVSGEANRIGAVNTVTVLKDGRLHGDNTDAFGFIENLNEHTSDLSHYLKHAVVLGAGGAARAICVALQDAQCKQITLVNRTKSKAQSIADRLGNITVALWEERERLLVDATLVVNTTSLGLKGKAPLELGLTHLSANALVTDIVYNPLETDLLKAAMAKGCHTVDGLGMLLHQARPGFQRWFGAMPRVDDGLLRYIKKGLAA